MLRPRPGTAGAFYGRRQFLSRILPQLRGAGKPAGCNLWFHHKPLSSRREIQVSSRSGDRSDCAGRTTQFAEIAAVDDGCVPGAADCAVRDRRLDLLHLDKRHRRPRDRAHPRCRARACAQGVRDHRPQPRRDQRGGARHAQRHHPLARTGPAPAPEAAGRFAAAAQIGLDLRCGRKVAGQQPRVAAAGAELRGPRLLLCPCRPDHRHVHRRLADAAPALSGRALLRGQPPPRF